MRSKLLLGMACAASIVGAAAFAQNVDGLDIQAVLGRASAAGPDAEALIEDVSRRGEDLKDEVRSVAEGGERNLRTSGALLGDRQGGPFYFDEIVKTAQDDGRGDKSAPQLIVFASLSMPEQSLKALIRDTAKAGGSVVFNGLPGGSMKAFQQGIMKVVENDGAYTNIGIDPRLFRAFEVTAVPAIVVVTSDFELCDGFHCRTALPPFDRMSGNVPLEYALETFVDGRGPGAAIAGQALARLRARPTR